MCRKFCQVQDKIFTIDLNSLKLLQNKQERKAFQVGETLFNYHVLITQLEDKKWGGGIKTKSHHPQTSGANIAHKHLSGL